MLSCAGARSTSPHLFTDLCMVGWLLGAWPALVALGDEASSFGFICRTHMDQAI